MSLRDFVPEYLVNIACPSRMTHHGRRNYTLIYGDTGAASPVMDGCRWRLNELNFEIIHFGGIEIAAPSLFRYLEMDLHKDHIQGFR